jgi:hypothetical protein
MFQRYKVGASNVPQCTFTGLWLQSLDLSRPRQPWHLRKKIKNRAVESCKGDPSRKAFTQLTASNSEQIGKCEAPRNPSPMATFSLFLTAICAHEPCTRGVDHSSHSSVMPCIRVLRGMTVHHRK